MYCVLCVGEVGEVGEVCGLRELRESRGEVERWRGEVKGVEGCLEVERLRGWKVGK